MSTIASEPVAAGIGRSYRPVLEALHRHGRPFTAADAARLLEMEPFRARRLLGYLARRGWLARVRQGLYVAVPLEARRSGEWIEDPWISVSESFSPCYIAGWSAAQHWELTEQLFRDILVVTAKPVRRRNQNVQGTPVRVKVVPIDQIFGTTDVWRRTVRVAVSDPSKTIVDVLDDPAMGGGIQHVSSVVREYFRSPHRDDQLLVGYAERSGNRTVFKRLGWLLEAGRIDAPELLATCRSRQSTGLSKLDPNVAAEGRIVRRWNLRVNVDVGRDGEDW